MGPMAKSKPTDSTPMRFAVLATDIALFTVRNGELLVRLISVKRPPHFPDNIGLPGGLLAATETAKEAAVRHLETKTGIDPKKVYLEQLYTFSRVERDPRGRVVAVAYLALAPWEGLSPAEQAGDGESWWARLSDAKKLAYDHDEILSVALERLRSRIKYTTLGSKLMPKEFTLTELERTYESVLKKDLDKRNFRKKILKAGALTELPRKKSGGRFRPAQLYRFASLEVKGAEVL